MNRVKAYLVLSLGVLVASLAVISAGNVVTATELPLRDGIDLTTQTPFQASGTVIWLGSEATVKTIDVAIPTGKLLVIESISFKGSSLPDNVFDFSYSTHVLPETTYRSHYLSAERQVINGKSYYVGSQSLKAYGDATYARFRIARVSADIDLVTFNFTMSGYFVNR